MYDVMDDSIDFVGIDAKHSFEEVILPVTEVKKLYGHRVSLLGVWVSTFGLERANT